MKMEESEMALEKSRFERIKPCRFTTLSFPNPRDPSDLLRVAVLDSATDSSGRVAAMSVPSGRESDWLFSSEPGHIHLLLSSPPPLSRLVLVAGGEGDTLRVGSLYRRRPDASFDLSSLNPLLLALSPKSSFERLGGGVIPEIPILSYEDGVLSSLVLGIFSGDSVGEMLVEDVEIEQDGFRRRLRFKRMPNLVQTEVRLLPKMGFGLDCDGLGGNGVVFSVNLSVLVHPYLAPMVASFDLICDSIEEKIVAGLKPRVLCLGVGGGALVSFLETRLGFEVFGVEEDEEVLRIGKKFFGLEEGEFVKLYIGDAIEFLRRDNKNGSDKFKFDAIMVDLDSSDLSNGACAPPVEFRRRHVLSCVRSMLRDKGVLVVNVVVPQSMGFYETIKSDFRKVFGELYEIDVGNEENYVLIATKSPVTISRKVDSPFANQLRKAISEAFIDSIRKA